ncbi:uncharacterized protein ACR2FA_008972 [Aphomia sociella]
MDVSKLCRSCMKEVASWERENFDSRATDMFSFCTNIKITEDDNLPRQFCYDCIIKIESSYTYIIEAQKVNITLKNVVSRATSVIVEPDSHTRNSLSNDIANNIKFTPSNCNVGGTIDNFDEPVFFDDIENDCQNNFGSCNMTDEKVEQKLSDSNNVEKQDSNKDVSVKETENVGENKKNICPVCRKCFTSKAWFAKHMEKEHTGNKYACTQCTKTFAKRSQLSYHATSHSEERQFECTEPACGKRFKRRKQLVAHARAHADVRPYVCDKCDMRFKIKSILKCHLKVHEKQKQYLCCFCGWSFTQAGNLKVHMRKHTGEKPFSCSECGFRAAAASNLRRHQRRHAGQRTHVCTYCAKGFFDASALARHARTHTRARPYACPGCTLHFADSWKRKSHLMRAHRLSLRDVPRMRRDGRPLPA